MFAQSKGGNYSLTNDASGVADAIDFDGVTDYLSRSSDLVGNADGKAFTFSCWVWRSGAGYVRMYRVDGAALRVRVECDESQTLVMARDSGGNNILYMDGAAGLLPKDTWTHVLISVDLTNTANRHFYVNDVNLTSSVSWSVYSNTNINFTGALPVVGGGDGSANKRRLAHVFLAYEYVDLSVEANRRLFITADRKPAANQSALNPILYLPLLDPTQPGKNLGTGGGFALNGVVARSGRGPSQFNAPYSDLNGTSQYLSRTSIAGITNSRKITVSFVFSLDSIGNNIPLLEFGSNTSPYYRYFQVVVLAVAKIIRIIGRAPNGSTDVVNFDMPGTIYVGRNYSVVFSFDLDDVNKRHAYLNGVSAATFNTYSASDVNLSISSVPAYRIGASVYSTASFIDGHLGNIFFDTRYIDLSQPANLAKFVTGTGVNAKPADLGANGEKPFGTPPLIYLPMYGNNAGKNYGTGGDFTVNSGPYPGARGPNEFWGNKADFDGSTGYLYRTSALTEVSDSKTFSCSFFLQPTNGSTVQDIVNINTNSGIARLRLYVQNSNTFSLYGYNSSNSVVFSCSVTSPYVSSIGQACIQISIDLTNSAKRNFYINGVAATASWSPYNNDFINLSAQYAMLGSATYNAATNPLGSGLSEFYFTTEYIDFSQEANRLKFRDAFGNPVDLAPQIAAGTLPNPAIYMRFDPANFGKNSGTGGDFTVSGTITDGGQL